MSSPVETVWDTPPHSVAAVGIVIRNHHVLIIQRADNSLWEPPAGILELDETFEQCVEREVHEETGIHVRAARVTGLYKEMTHPKHPVVITWLCEYINGEPTRSDESLDVRWVPLANVSTLVRPAHLERITDAANATEHEHEHEHGRGRGRGLRIAYHNGTDPCLSSAEWIKRQATTPGRDG